MDYTAMSASGRLSSDRETHWVLVAYVLLVAEPFVFATTHAWFWRSGHLSAPIATGIVAGLLVALVYRQRWAWVLLVVLNGVVVVSHIFGSAEIYGIIINALALVLVVSRPMRRYVGMTRKGASQPEEPVKDRHNA
jgi:hypothetical protein